MKEGGQISNAKLDVSGEILLTNQSRSQISREHDRTIDSMRPKKQTLDSLEEKPSEVFEKSTDRDEIDKGFANLIK